MYDFVHRWFQKLIVIIALSALIVLSSCVSSPDAEASREPAMPDAETETVAQPARVIPDETPPDTDNENDNEARTKADQDDPNTAVSRGTRQQPQPEDSGIRDRPRLTADVAIENVLTSMTLR